ncbi:MAG: hypothetical protein NTV44_01675, partial [Firmicutes bacterium]|nr:hypothetical protein [Bacillota bacterium]
MLNKQLKQWGIIFSALFLTALIVIAGTPDLPVKATETPAYAIALTGTNHPNIPGEGFGAGSLTAKSVNFAYVNADDNVPSGQHVLLSYSGGAINNTNLITGLSRVTAIFSTGDLTLYYGNDLNPTANSAALPSGVAFSFSESIYFRIVASGTVDALIESIVIGY